jgi:hypothetical protein
MLSYSSVAQLGYTGELTKTELVSVALIANSLNLRVFKAYSFCAYLWPAACSVVVRQ